MRTFYIDYLIGDVPYNIRIRARSPDAAKIKLLGLYVPAIAAKITIVKVEEYVTR